MHRRRFIQFTLGASAGSLLLAGRAGAQPGVPATTGPASADALPPMTVYKSAACGCCHSWIAHVRGAGFTVRTVDTEDLASVKREMGIPPRLEACHTVMVGKYLVEGHVPAADVKRLLAEKPAVRGLAVPGMPIGAPGMEQGPPSGYQRYEVLAFQSNGTTSVFARH
jgi:hypothetical protein